jgi:alcohol dehydrogenase (cytochrome c)
MNSGMILRSAGRSALLAALATAITAQMTAPCMAQSPADNAADWPVYNRSLDGSRFSPLKEITSGNIQNLQVAWIHQPGAITQGLVETPLVIDGIVYSVASGDRVFALDGVTGKEIWHYYPHLDDVINEIVYTPLVRGVAVAHGHVYLGTLDGRAVALDQKTGKEVWSTQLVQTRKCGGCNFTSAPVVAGNTVVLGQTGGDLATQGKIFGVEAATGKQIWAFETLKDDPKSWGGDSRRTGGGGAWTTGAYDPKSHSVFYGTGNPAPDYDWGGARPGDNLYTNSVVALDPDTGKLKWYHQEVPHDFWDYDSSTGQFVIVERDGARSLIHYNKGGFVFVYNPENGDIRNVWQLNKYVTWTSGVDPKSGVPQDVKAPKFGEQNYACPWLVGSWQSSSYSPVTGLLYSTVVEACNTIDIEKLSPENVPLSALFYGGTATGTNPPDSKAYGHLDARDPVSGTRKWEFKSDLPIYSSVLTTAGGLVFVGDVQGLARALDAETGKELWSFNLGSGMHGGPISYEAGGHQYILIPSGLGGLGMGFVAQIWPEVADFPAGAALVAFRVK